MAEGWEACPSSEEIRARETGPARKTDGFDGHRGRPYKEAPRTRTSEDVPASTAVRG